MEIRLPLYPGKKEYKVGKILVKPGDFVKEGDLLTNIETSKGTFDITAKIDGLIEEIRVKPGEEVVAGDIIFIIKPSPKNTTENTANESKSISTDLLVIGGGPGGYVTAIYAAKKGLDVCLVEGKTLGGTCLNFGCIPTKAIQRSSKLYRDIKDCHKLGININGDISFDYEAIIDYKDGIVDELINGIEYLLEANKIKFIQGHASFIDERKVFVNDINISAKNIIIATGAKLARLDVIGSNLDGVQTAKEALSDKNFPKSITIIGAGVNSMEFAFMYDDFGANVNILTHRDQILRGIDLDAKAYIENELNHRDIHINYNSAITSIEKTDDGLLKINFNKGGLNKSIKSDRVLIAIGGPINIEGLGLDKTNIKLSEDKSAIKVNGYLQTNLKHIYAIGDVNRIANLAHAASFQGMIAVDHILDKENVSEFDIYKTPHIIYTSPEIGTVGYNEEILKEKDINYKKEVIDFSSIGKTLIDSDGKGFIKVLMDKKTHKILGATIVGDGIENLISDFALAITNELTIDDISKTIYAHPTASELISEISFKLLGFGIHNL